MKFKLFNIMTVAMIMLLYGVGAMSVGGLVYTSLIGELSRGYYIVVMNAAAINFMIYMWMMGNKRQLRREITENNFMETLDEAPPELREKIRVIQELVETMDHAFKSEFHKVDIAISQSQMASGKIYYSLTSRMTEKEPANVQPEYYV